MTSPNRAAQRPPDVEEATSLNLVPMVDIMFLMLLFFMLGSDMGQRELEDVVLPEATTVREDPGEPGPEGRTTVNVYHEAPGRADCAEFSRDGGVCRHDDHWKIGVRGRDFHPLRPEDVDRLRGLLKRDAAEAKAIASDRWSERKVMIRADRGAPYGAVQRVIELCSECGLYKVEAGAAQAVPDAQ